MKASDLSRVDAAFFTVNGYVSVLFFLFWAADMYVCRRVVEHAGHHRRSLVCCPSSRKVEAGARLDCERWPHALSAPGYSRRRLHGESRARAHARQRHLLQRQPPHQSHRRVRGQLQAVRVRQEGARTRRPTRCRSSRSGTGAGDGWSEAITEFHIVGGLHPGTDAGLVLRDAARAEAALPARAPEGVHHGGDRHTSRSAARSPCAKSLERLQGRRHGFDARRRRGDLLRARAPHHLRSQDRRRRVAGRGARTRTSWACAPTAPCSTATSRPKRTAWITC